MPAGPRILLGPDPKEELGTLYIRLRHAVREDGARLIELAPAATGLSEIATARLHARPGEVGAVARALVAGGATTEVGGVDAEAINAAHALLEGPVTIVGGRASLAESTAPTLEALDALTGIDGARVLPLVRRGNAMGALDMGMSPGLLPGRTSLDAGRTAFADAWGSAPEATGMDTNEILAAAEAGDIDVLILLGADPVSDAVGTADATAALANVDLVVSVDLFANASNQHADVVLPAAAFTEADGSHTNIEGRISPIRQKVTPPGTARPDWMIAAELAGFLDADLGILAAEDVWAQLAPLSAVHGDVTAEAIDADDDGVLVTATGRVAFEPPSGHAKVDPIDGYALRLATARRMFDDGTVVQACRHLAGLAGDALLRVNPYDFNRLGVRAGEAVRATSSGGTISVGVAADDGVPRGVALLDYNRSGADARDLFDHDAVSIDVRLETGP